MAFVAVIGLSLTQCAPLLKRRAPEPTLYVTPSERLFFRVIPFDSTVKAELAQGGIDPARFEEEFIAEVRYRFSTRKQEEAQDSSSATVILLAEVRHLQPGVGNAGTYAEFSVTGRRRKEPVKVDWTWTLPSSENKPADLRARDLNRGAADQLMNRIRQTPPRPKEPPPPLQLL
jgi:hypothetical protein